MINSKQNILLIIFVFLAIYISLVAGSVYFAFFWFLMLILEIISYFRNKKCENKTLDIISQLYAQNKQIDIEKLSDQRNCKFTQDSLKFFNYYKRKGLIPFDAELVDPNNYSSHTFK
ncbi:hypothetical protein [Sulfurimonas sp.]